MKKIIIGTVLGLIMALSAFAQTRTVTVSGRIIESDSKQPAIQATVQLLALPDSTQAAAQPTTVNGHFRLTAKSGKYVMKVTYLGFKTKYVPVQLAASSKNLGDIKPWSKERHRKCRWWKTRCNITPQPTVPPKEPC